MQEYQSGLSAQARYMQPSGEAYINGIDWPVPSQAEIDVRAE